jgi:hypothetical protein
MLWYDLVAVAWVRPSNAWQAISHQHTAEIDDSTAASWRNLGSRTELGVQVYCKFAAYGIFVYNVGSAGTAAECGEQCADVAELADAIDLGSIARKGVEVRVLSSAPGAVWGPVA